MNYNRVMLGGHLTRDPELTYTQKGVAICKFGLAVNHNWTNDAGEKIEEVSFFDCVAWGKRGETIAQYVKKGNPLFVEGRLKQDQWEDRQTQQKRYAIRVIIENFQFLSKGPGNGGGKAPEKTERPDHRAVAGLPPAGDTSPYVDDDVPF